MQSLVLFMETLYSYLFTLIGLDFTNYSGNLPVQLLSMYEYVIKFYQLVIVFFFLYLTYNTIYFLISLGSIRKK